MLQFDIALFDAAWKLSASSVLVKFFSIFFGQYLAYVVVVVFIIETLTQKDRAAAYKRILFTVFSLALSYGVIQEIVRVIANRPRPFVVFQFDPFIAHAATPSLPSGHAVFFFTLAFVLMMLKEKNWVYYLIAAILIGAGRVFAGVHWPFDIIAGVLTALLGVFVAKLIFILKREPPTRKISEISKE